MGNHIKKMSEFPMGQILIMNSAKETGRKCMVGFLSKMQVDCMD